ncbi:MAG: DUF4114 domain-containing protein [Candidatus Eisenbacteria bacterium]
MKRLATTVLGTMLLVALANTAFAALRVPQVPVLGGGLQGYLNANDGGINVATDQNAVQTWSTTVSNNSTFSLMIELSGNAAANSIGIYNGAAAVPALYQVFPGAAASGWFATAAFRTLPTRVVVNLFDASAALQGTTTYLGADRTNFGYYLSGPGGTFYSQDVRNAGSAAQALTYAGTGVNSGQWWLGFEDTQIGGGSDQDYDDAVLFLESVNPTPVSRSTWGALKSRMR